VLGGTGTSPDCLIVEFWALFGVVSVLAFALASSTRSLPKRWDLLSSFLNFWPFHCVWRTRRSLNPAFWPFSLHSLCQVPGPFFKFLDERWKTCRWCMSFMNADHASGNVRTQFGPFVGVDSAGNPYFRMLITRRAAGFQEIKLVQEAAM
jgi:hypothetical protein